MIKQNRKDGGIMIEWIEIYVETEGDVKVPFFTGSMLRGVLGYALKRVVCINPSYKCEGCFAADDCLFYHFYEAKNVFHSYRFGITLQPKRLDFSFYLFEDAVESLPYILSAIKKSLEELGVGREKKTVKIKKIRVGEQTVYDGKAFLSLKEIKPNTLEIDNFCQDVTLNFIMPIRIKENNTFAREQFSLHTLIGNIHSRYRQLKGLAPERLGYRVHGEIVKSTLKFVETQRYSSRQKSGMKMGGLKGEITIIGLDKQSYVYLKIGEIIGAGKQTVFGLGSYEIKGAC